MSVNRGRKKMTMISWVSGNNGERAQEGMRDTRRALTVCLSEQFHVTGPKFKRKIKYS